MIVYNGCDTWAGSKLCGMFAVPAGSTRAFSDGVVPVLLSHEPSDIPTDSKGNLIAFREEPEWSRIYALAGALSVPRPPARVRNLLKKIRQ